MEHRGRGTLRGALERLGIGVWQVLTSPYAILALLGLLFIMAMMGGILPQAGRGMPQDASEYERWLGQARLRWGGALTGLHSLGLLDFSHMRVFRVLLAAVGAEALLGVLLLWVPAWACPPSHPREVLKTKFPCALDETWRRAARSFVQAGMHLSRPARVGDAQWALAQRHPLARALVGLFCMGILTLLGAAWVAQRYGWVGPDLDLSLGETRPLERNTGLAVRLDEIALVPQGDGTPHRLNAELALLKGADVVRRVTLGSGRRATYDGLALYPLGNGPALRVNAQDAEERPLNLQPMLGDTAAKRVIRVRFVGAQQEQVLSIAKADLLVRLVHYPALPAQGIQGRAIHVQLRRGSDGQLLAEQFLGSSGRVAADGITVDVAFEYYVTLRAEREPELPLAALGGALWVVGMIGLVAWPRQSVWLLVRQTTRGSTCELLALRGEAEAAWLSALAAQWREGQDD